MRPRKKILLHCVDEDRRSVLAFVLDNRGYRVIAGLGRDEDIALAILVDDGAESEAFANIASEYMPELHAFVLIRHQVRGARAYPPCFAFVDNKVEISDLLERIRIVASRKRGPKKRGPYGPRVATQEAVTA